MNHYSEAIFCIREKIFINKAWFSLVILFVFVNLAFLIERFVIISQPPVVYEYVEFLTKKEFQTKKIKTNFLNNENLIKSLSYKYVLNREIYPHQKLDMVKAMSYTNVWSEFENFKQVFQQRLNQRSFNRLIEVKMYQKLSHDVRQLELEAVDFMNDQKITQRFKVNLKFEFVDEMVRADRVDINPSGFKITHYSIELVK